MCNLLNLNIPWKLGITVTCTEVISFSSENKSKWNFLTCDEQRLLPNCIALKPPLSVCEKSKQEEGEKTGPDMYHAKILDLTNG